MHYFIHFWKPILIWPIGQPLLEITCIRIVYPKEYSDLFVGISYVFIGGFQWCKKVQQRDGRWDPLTFSFCSISFDDVTSIIGTRLNYVYLPDITFFFLPIRFRCQRGLTIIGLLVLRDVQPHSFPNHLPNFHTVFFEILRSFSFFYRATFFLFAPMQGTIYLFKFVSAKNHGSSTRFCSTSYFFK